MSPSDQCRVKPRVKPEVWLHLSRFGVRFGVKIRGQTLEFGLVVTSAASCHFGREFLSRCRNPEERPLRISELGFGLLSDFGFRASEFFAQRDRREVMRTLFAEKLRVIRTEAVSGQGSLSGQLIRVNRPSK
jgi:hypothetical protein